MPDSFFQGLHNDVPPPEEGHSRIHAIAIYDSDISICWKLYLVYPHDYEDCFRCYQNPQA